MLNNIQSGTASNGKDYNWVPIMGTQAGQQLFEFVANNTNVEWSLIKFGEGGMRSNILSTSHDEKAEYGGSDLLNNDPFIKISDFRGFDHNHPNGDWHPSSASLPLGDPGRKTGDIGMATMLEKRYPNTHLDFRIYTDTDDSYFNYNSQTVIPYEIGEVSVVANKKKNKNK